MTEQFIDYLPVIGFGVVAIIVLIYTVLNRPDCPNCKTKMKAVDYSDPLEPKISGKVRLNITTGVPHRITRHYKCPKCGNKLSRKELSWDTI